MSDRTEDIRLALQATCEEHEQGLHLSEAELIDYHQGRLEEPEQDRVQSHLVLCEFCRQTLQAVASFLQPPEEQNRMTDDEVDEQWTAFRKRLGPPETTIGLDKVVWPRLKLPEGAYRQFLIAASLVLGMGLVLWAFQLKQENQHLFGQLQAVRETSSHERSKLEGDTRHWQEQARRAQLETESQLAQLRQPDLNTPIFEIFSTRFDQRGPTSGQAQIARIKVPPATKRFVLVLNGEGRREYPDYAVELRDENHRLVWQADGLTRNAMGNWTLALNRASVAQGQYRLVLKGRRGGRVTNIAEYVVRLE